MDNVCPSCEEVDALEFDDDVYQCTSCKSSWTADQLSQCVECDEMFEKPKIDTAAIICTECFQAKIDNPKT